MLPHLERYATMAELVAAYFADAAGGEKERWLMRPPPDCRVLHDSFVEEAPALGRARRGQLITASEGRD